MSNRLSSVTDLRAWARRRDQIALSRSRVVVFVLVLAASLLVIGLGATLSASSASGIIQESDRLAVFKRQMQWVVVGLCAMVIMAMVPYNWYRKIAPYALGLSFAGLLVTLMVGVRRGGANRWLEFGDLTVQVSEFSKLAVIVFLASVLARRRDRLDEPSQWMGPMVFAVGGTCALIVWQPDLGTAIIVAGAAGVMMIAAGVPFRYIAAIGSTGLAVIGYATYSLEYRRQRFLCFLDPLSDPSDACFQMIQSLIALGSGHWLGVGLGASRSRWSYLPNPYTDFIFTIIGEETGFIGASALLVALAGLSLVGVWVAYRTSDMFARLLASGITAWLGVQSLVNVGGAVGAIPVTGLALPLVSVGGSAMVVAMAGVGILVNVARNAPHVPDPALKRRTR